MKKIILFLLLLISFSVFSQNPDRFRNGIRTPFVQPDTLSTANRDALTPKLGTIIFHKDTGFSRWEQWDGSDWVAFGGGSGSVNFASILGSPHDNANLGQSLDSTVHKWGNETIDSVKTFLRNLDLSPVKTVKSAKSQYRPLIKIGNQEFLNYLTDYWNGSSWTSTNGFGIGRQAIGNNKGKEVTGIGDYSLENNIGDQSVGVGNSALKENTAAEATAIGYLTGQYSTGAGSPLYAGSYAGRYNSGTSDVFLGHNSGTNSKANYSTATGSDAMNTGAGSFNSVYGYFGMRFNNGSYNNGLGAFSLYSALGDRNNGIGNYSLQYVKGNDNNVLGYNSFSELLLNPSGNKTFTSGDVNTMTDEITIVAHGFGATSSLINLKLTGAGATLGTGYSDGSTNKWTVIDANTIKAVSNDITSVGSGTMTLTPQQTLNNVNIIGNNLQPTQSDQTILGGATVVGPNTNKAAGIAGGNKVFLTREMGDQLYTGGGGGGTITLPLDATDIADGSVTNTEFQYMNTVTSNIQTQLDGKLDPTDILDEDDMLSNSDTHVPSQQSVKAYVDTQNALNVGLNNAQYITGFKTITRSTTGNLINFENTGTGEEVRIKMTADNLLGDPQGYYFGAFSNADGNYYGWGRSNSLNSSYSMKLERASGVLHVYSLEGVGNRMVIAEADGKLSTQAIPSGGGYSGNYKFTAKSGNETLDSTIVKSATSGRFDKMWRTYTTNLAEITVPGNLPVGWSSVIEAGAATDSILIKADTGVDIYGRGNVLVKSGDGIDGLWLKGGDVVALIYKGANSVRAEGPWNVATLAPTNLYDTANAASPIAEANATTGFTGVGTTFSSVTSPKTDGAYSIQGVTDTSTERWIYIARPSGVTAGKSYTIEIYIATNDVSPGSSLNISTSNQWSASSSVAIDLTDGNFKKYTITGTLSSISDANSGRIRIYIDNFYTTTTTWRVDNILWYEN